MIYAQSHGKGIFRSTGHRFAAPNMVGSYAYLFENLPTVSHGSATVRTLDKLAAQMITPDGEHSIENSQLPPILTYFGQFIDHDITAGTDGNPGGFDSSDDAVKPIDRVEVAALLRNLRSGKLDLDSIYGGEVESGSFDERLKSLLRHPSLPGKMLIGTHEDVGDTIAPPDDIAADLVRLGRFIGRGLEESELRSLPDESLRAIFFFADQDAIDGLGAVNIYRAIIADARNDENLFVAQLHLAFLRLHNTIVDSCADASVRAAGSDALYEWARRHTRWVYQWLVVNAYLGQLCDGTVLNAVIEKGAPLYTAFSAKVGAPDDVLPMPIEFSTAAFRFGHSMVRQKYDWNRIFKEAELSLLFSFTGGVSNPMFGVTKDRLPSNWPADWSRLATTSPGTPDRSARRIDTNLSFELKQLPDRAVESSPPAIPNLASANLRKGHLLNLPSAQSCRSAAEQGLGIVLPALTQDELTSGATGKVIKGTELEKDTPLWFYILKEAEVLRQGNQLGPLGSALVADTLMGLLIADKDSYWHQPGSLDNEKWHPRDLGPISGQIIDGMPAMLRAALVL